MANCGRRTLEWLCAHTPDFAITCSPTDSIPWQVKPLAELMFMLSTLTRHGVRSRSLDRLTAAAIAESSTFDWHELAAYDPSAATGMAMVADFFQTLDLPVPFDDRYFRLLHTIQYFEGMDRLPYRDMDLAYALARTVSADYEHSIPLWFSSTAFGRRQHTVRYSIDDVYSLTHAVFYLSDVGLRSTSTLLNPEMNARLCTELPTLTAAMLRADNADVLGELLLCWLFCRIEPTALNRLIFKAALDQMTAAVTDDGAVAQNLHTLREASAGRGTFQQLYHTTLVAAILFNLMAETDIYAIH